MLGSLFGGIFRGILKGATNVALYQAGRMARGLPHTVGRIAATGMRGAVYRGTGHVARHTLGTGAKILGKTVGSQFFRY